MSHCDLPQMMPDVMLFRWRDELVQITLGCLGIEGLFAMYNQAGISYWIGFEWIVNIVSGYVTLYEVTRVDNTDKILLKDVINVLLLMYCEDIPVRINCATSCPKDDFTTCVDIKSIT